ncbi:hypothetical protein [Marininema halotolerans]|nr:hypothetical protein [Marininema halotolerans]
MFKKNILNYLFRPNDEMDSVLSSQPYWSILWAALFGVTFLGTQVFVMNGGERYAFPEFFIEILYKGPIIGILFCGIYGTTVFLLAKLIRGEGSYLATLTSYAWSTLIYSGRLLLVPLQLLLFGGDMFSKVTVASDGSFILITIYILVVIVDILLLGWFIRTVVLNTMEIHEFRWWQSLLIHFLSISMVWWTSLKGLNILFFPV